ncbi:MAG: DUF3082 domain-containing protein [Aphanizomenon sp.]|jgi:hypothetical protein
MNQPQKTPSADSSTQVQATPLRCIIGSTISGGFAFATYSLMIAIATTFANKPTHSDNQTVINIASAVRTLVVGIVALGAGIFGLVALGLFALSIQLFIQQLSKPKSS